MPTKRTPIYKACENCGTMFRTKPSHAARRRFCSRTCKGMPFITLTCQHCGKQFRKHDTKQWRATKYCSNACYAAARAALSAEDRKTLMAAAQDAVRGVKRTHADLCLRALGKQRNAHLSDDERQILIAFEDAGLDPVPQFAVDKYNVDFAFPDERLAVEYHGGNWHNTDKKRREDQAKAECLAREGWNLIVLPRLYKPESRSGNASMKLREMVCVVRDALRLRQAA